MLHGKDPVVWVGSIFVLFSLGFFWKQKCKCWLLCMTLDNVKSGETVPFPWVLWIFHIVSPINTEQSQEQTYILIGL